MRLFHLQPEDKQFEYEIDASHMWGLPGVQCSACGRTWSTTGIAYPALDLSKLPSVGRYCNPSPVAVEELLELRASILPLSPAEFVLPPGAEFGPLVGRARGRFGDFAWVNPWTMLIRREALLRLTSEHIRLPRFVAPHLNFGSEPPVDLLELQIEPHASLSVKSFVSGESSSCSVCAYDARKVQRVIVSRASIPSRAELFRLRDFPTLILATEYFVKIVRKWNMTGILMSEVDIDE